jgi:hypothetical protein
MNTSDSQNRENLVRPDYYTLLWFENGQLTAAVLQDDYTAWFDLAAGIEGSNLADANSDDVTREQLVELLREWYLTEETATLYYTVIETNEPEVAAHLYPEFIERGFKYIQIQPKHDTTLLKIRQRAHEQFKAWTEGNA